MNVVPIVKKDKKEDPRHSRPVSLTLIANKIIEKFILGSIEKHLEDNTGISQSQHGFMRGTFCL